MDDAIWAAEKAILKAEFEWKEANVVMEQLMLKPQLLTFRAWLWASATVSFTSLMTNEHHACWFGPGVLVNRQ